MNQRIASQLDGLDDPSRRRLLGAGSMATLAASLSSLAPLTGLAQSSDPEKWALVDDELPTAKFTDIDTNVIDFSALKGRMVIVNFWATWCAPCIAEMPALQNLVKQLGPKAMLVGVNYHESAEKIRGFREKYSISFPLVRDPWHEISAAWKVKMLPSTLIIDPKGRLRYRVLGEMVWDAPAVVAKVKTLSV